MTTSLLKVSFGLGLLLLSSPSISAQNVSDRKTRKPNEFPITATVDERVELMSIIARLAGYWEYSSDKNKLYADDVHKHFDKYQEHPAVLFARQIRKTNQVSFDAVMKMAVHLSPPPALVPRTTFSDQVPEERWGRQAGEEFVRLLQKFYRDADCKTFFRSHSALYDETARRFQALLNKVDFSWYRTFYGEVFSSRFNLFIGMLNGGASYSAKVVHPDGREELYAVIGVGRVDNAGVPVFGDDSLPTIIHEYNHTFVNHLVIAHEQQLHTAGERVYGAVAEKMNNLSYGTWQSTIFESLVRAAVIRYMFDHHASVQAIQNEIVTERNKGFLWMDELFALLGVYENSRRTHPTFASFFPLIEGYFNDLAKRIDYEAKMFEELRPRVVAVQPITNGAQDVDPGTTRLTFTFDRPLEKESYSIFIGSSGSDHYPIESVIGYSESGQAFIVQVKLRPNWEYEFLLSGQAFMTKDGYPLQDYAVKFKTKKE